ncbi:unnamed protein product [Gadus morhua 'NCC']
MEQRSAAPSAYCVVRSLHLCTRSLLLMDTLAGFEVPGCLGPPCARRAQQQAQVHGEMWSKVSRALLSSLFTSFTGFSLRARVLPKDQRPLALLAPSAGGADLLVVGPLTI